MDGALATLMEAPDAGPPAADAPLLIDLRDDGFDAAFHRLLPRSIDVGRRILGDTAGAEDAASEALARALASWRRVSKLDYLDAWVLKVTANVAIDMVRRRHEVLDLTDEALAVDPAAPEDRMLVGTALAELPRRQRQVVALRYLADLSEADTARVLHISVGSVKRHAHRALAALRRSLVFVEIDDD